MKQLIIFCLVAIMLTACESLDPRPIQHLTTDELLESAVYGEGLLTAAYANLNTTWDINSEYFTDNAIPSEAGTNNLAMGAWTLEANPIGSWDLWYNSIRYCNEYLEKCNDLLFSVSDPTLNGNLKRNRRAEAFFLRAWYHWQLLQTYGGFAPGVSEALGIPLITSTLSSEDNLNLPRNTYEECVTQIVEDLDSAIAVLPLRYNGSKTWNNIKNRGRASGLGAMALKARVYLYAASPAYGPSTTDLWERAAQAAYSAITATGGLTNLVAYGNFNTSNNFDYIWIQPPFSSHAWEASYYPPSIYGSGNCNPSENLIDAFPAKNGYPITESTQYDPLNPYANRDPRFDAFIFYNGNVYNATTIETYEGGKDAPGGLTQQGTRTGYYMKKLSSKNVKLTPGNITNDNKLFYFLSRAELYLNFAEAANEAFGPDDATLGISAQQALEKIRQRAGIDSNSSMAGYQDQFLSDQAASGKDAFRELIYNERRIELCFEGQRFWDIRRLDLPLNHTIEGVKITNIDGNFSFQYGDVESHVFEDYMRYIPLPFEQTLLMSNLKQNNGW